VYAQLLEDGYTPESMIRDSPLPTSIYRPHNYKRGYYGRMTIRTALARSRNVPAINAFYLAGGEERILAQAEQYGIVNPLAYKRSQQVDDPDFAYKWPLALGTGEASLLEMVQGYSVLASGGLRRPLTGIARITSGSGETVYEPASAAARVMSAQTAAYLTDILSDEDAREPLWRFGQMTVPDHRAAVKTGTSNVCLERDKAGVCLNVLANNTWTIGYTDELLVGVWVGNVDNTPLIDKTSAFDIALPVWRDFMRTAYSEQLIDETAVQISAR
jgi:membrane peptidoglycan carboxypeptidase